MFEKLVVPLDGSELGEIAVTYAAALAGPFNSEIHLLNIAESKAAAEIHVHEGYLSQVAERLSVRVPGVRVSTLARPGDAAGQILDYAEQTGGLLIITSHGRSGRMPWPMGSTATKIISRLRRPILFVPVSQSSTTPYPVFRDVLVTLDGSPAGEAPLAAVRELVSHIVAPITLLRVVAAGYQVQTIGGLDYLEVPATEVDRLVAEAKRYLEDAVRQIPGGAAIEVRVGDAARIIVEFAAERGFSLVAASSHGHSAVERWAFGSVSHKVLNSIQTPVLVVPANR